MTLLGKTLFTTMNSNWNGIKTKYDDRVEDDQKLENRGCNVQLDNERIDGEDGDESSKKTKKRSHLGAFFKETQENVASIYINDI